MPATPTHRASVRVVDDSPTARAAAGAVVDATRGFAVVSLLATGEEALAWLQRFDVDLVLMDVRMPGMGGVAAARIMRHLRDPPVVVLLSADDHPDIAARPGEHGAVAFLRKEALGPRSLHRIWARFASQRALAGSRDMT
jgi:CheY-like chemotaxis protein